MTVEARVVPPGGETPSAWTKPLSLTRRTRGIELPDIRLADETVRNIAANQELTSWQKTAAERPVRERVGGVVLDTEGRPVAGAAVEVLFESGCGLDSAWTNTDAAGKWSLLVPEGQASLELRIDHHDFVGHSMDRHVKSPPLPRLRDRTGVVVLEWGLRLQGRVRDAGTMKRR